jgi:hypothetical protein
MANVEQAEARVGLECNTKSASTVDVEDVAIQ